VHGEIEDVDFGVFECGTRVCVTVPDVCGVGGLRMFWWIWYHFCAGPMKVARIGLVVEDPRVVACSERLLWKGDMLW